MRYKKFASVLDKHREVSIQECVYRLLGLPMAKFSVKVKFLNTSAPKHRDGLLRRNVEELSNDESVFYPSPHQYYENRPLASDEKFVNYDDEEMVEGYWENLSLTDFWSDYEIVYDRTLKSQSKVTRIQTLLNGKGFIRKRLESAVLRYFINYDNDEDMARSLLILFLPFRNEMEEIHNQDVKELLETKKNIIISIL